MCSKDRRRYVLLQLHSKLLRQCERLVSYEVYIRLSRYFRGAFLALRSDFGVSFSSLTLFSLRQMMTTTTVTLRNQQQQHEVIYSNEGIAMSIVRAKRNSFCDSSVTVPKPEVVRFRLLILLRSLIAQWSIVVVIIPTNSSSFLALLVDESCSFWSVINRRKWVMRLKCE